MQGDKRLEVFIHPDVFSKLLELEEFLEQPSRKTLLEKMISFFYDDMKGNTVLPYGTPILPNTVQQYGTTDLPENKQVIRTVSMFTGFNDVPVVEQDIAAYDKLLIQADERRNVLRKSECVVVPISENQMAGERQLYDVDGEPYSKAD